MFSTRVVHVVPTLFDPNGNLIGGAERYALELAKRMAEATPTRLVSFGQEKSTFDLGLLRVEILHPSLLVSGEANNPLSLGIAAALVRSSVLHTHQTFTLGNKLLAVAGRLFGKPVFTTDLGGGGWSIETVLPARRWYTGHLHISEYSRRVYGHEQSKNSRVILGGVDAETFKPGRGGSGVLYVGRVLPHKGLDDLIQALPDSIPLHIVGPETNEPYSQMLRLLAKGKRVVFSGAQNDSFLARAYADADMIVLPSVYRDCYGHHTNVPELLGQTLLEGMAAGLPAIATRVASLPEVVDDTVTGFLVAPNNKIQLRGAIEKLLHEPLTAKMMGAAGRQRVLKFFSWEATINRCFEAYASLGRVKFTTVGTLS